MRLKNPEGLFSLTTFRVAEWRFFSFRGKNTAGDPPSGTEWTISRYVETADAITAIYKPTPIYAPPRTFSKLKLVAALSTLNLWAAFRDWLVETDHYDIFVAAQSFREDHPSFTAILYSAQERFCLSDHEIEDILSKCVADD